MDKYIDRSDAGKALANHLKKFRKQEDAVILALPRGGVPVAYEIATELSLPLDVFIVRKLGVPGHEELAMGAIASGGTVLFNEPLMHQLNLDGETINSVVRAEKKELERREHYYRSDRLAYDLAGKTVILVDDGMATGSTMRAAIEAIKHYNPASIIIAVPVAAAETCDEMESLVDEIICPLKPIHFYAVGVWYEDFPQTSDEEVIRLLAAH